MKKQAALFGGVVVVGLILGTVLIPSDAEVGLMRFKDKDFVTARTVYQRRYELGDHSVGVVLPLTEIHLNNGDVETAIVLTERFVADHPANFQAWRRLATLHQFAQMPDSYLADLEAMANLRPEPATLRELAKLYRFRQRTDDEIAVLARLARDHQAIPAEYLDLANLQVAAGRGGDALATLAHRRRYYPDDDNVDAVLLSVNLLIHAHRDNDAFAQAEAWLHGRHDVDSAVLLAGQIAEDGHAAAGLRLLSPYLSLADADHLDLLSEVTWLELSSDRGADALGRLVALRRQGRLPAKAVPQLVQAALMVGQPATALEAINGDSLPQLPNDLIAAIGQAAVAANRPDLALKAFAELSDAFKGRNPVLAADLALQLKDRRLAAEWVARAEQARLAPADSVRLTELLIALDRPQDALTRLDRLIRDRDLPPSALPSFAASLCAANLAAPALPILATARVRMPSAGADQAWAVVALRAGEAKQVAAWLDTVPKESGGALTDALYVAARDAWRPDLALVIARRMAAANRSAANTLNLVEALSANGHWAEAQPMLAAVRPSLPSDDTRLIEVMMVAFKAGAPLGGELRGYWRGRYAAAKENDHEEAFEALLDIRDFAPILAEMARRAKADPDEWLAAYAEASIKLGNTRQLIAMLEGDLSAATLDEERLDDRLEWLEKAAGRAATLPHLRRLADRFGGDWIGTYEEALDQLGRRPELLAYLLERAHQPAISAEQSREIAYQILDLGDKDAAEALFRALAATAPAESEDVNELLFLWGPRPSAERVAWLAGRLRNAPSAAERLGWLRQMIAVEAPAAAVEAVEPQDLAKDSTEMVTLWADALGAVRDSSAVAARLRAAMDADSSPDHLRIYAEAAYDAESWDLALGAYGKLMAAHPKGGDDRRRLIDAAMASADKAAAAQALQRYLAATPDDAEALADLGELLAGLDDEAGAQAAWQAALDTLDRHPQATGFEQRRLKAVLLQRLDRNKEAAEIYAALVAERPKDQSLRADLAAALLDSSQIEAAGAALDQSEP